MPWGGGTVYEVEIAGAMRNVLTVGQEALSEWEALLKRNRLPIQVPDAPSAPPF
jgi:hypothetical protein